LKIKPILSARRRPLLLDKRYFKITLAWLVQLFLECHSYSNSDMAARQANLVSLSTLAELLDSSANGLELMICGRDEARAPEFPESL
jgi:hypothetical protein